MKIEEIKEMAESHVLEPTGDEFCDYRTGLMLKDSRWYGEKIEAYYSFFYKLAKKLQPKVVLELGGWRGDSACHFARAIEGEVITIDHHTDSGDEEHNKAMQEAEQNCPNMTFVKGWTTYDDALEQMGQHALGDAGNAFPVVEKILDGRTVDLLFIDSWHHYEHCKRDWDVYSPLLSEHALVIVDDVCSGSPEGGIYKIDKFWEEMVGEKYLNKTIHTGYPIGFCFV